MLEFSIIYIVIAAILCLMMTWGVGANDLANVMSTTMGSKALTVKQAMCIAIIFEFAGAFLGGSEVTDTMRDGIINLSQLNGHPKIIIEGMLAVLLAGTVWMNFASYMGLPVSITNAIVGSVVGFGMVVLGIDAIHWQQVGFIAISWVSSPLIAGITAFFLFSSIQRLIFSKRNPLQLSQKYLPLYLLLVGGVLSIMVTFKGMHHFGITLTPAANFVVTLVSTLLVAGFGLFAIKQIPIAPGLKRRDSFLLIEKQFAVLMAMTACAMVFAHGSNDVAIAVGPLSLIYGLLQPSTHMLDNNQSVTWIVLLGCIGVSLGLLIYGRKVIETVGSGITALTPSRAFAATLAAATTVLISTSTGIPVSATQTLVGAVLGVGLARGIGALNLIVIRNIFMSWIITLPAASLLTIIFFRLINAMM